jgi:hypothetical protein
VLDELFSRIRIIDGVTDTKAIVFSRFRIFEYEKSKFTWYL